MLYSLEEKGKKCAIKANNFSNPGTMFMLVPYLAEARHCSQIHESCEKSMSCDGVATQMDFFMNEPRLPVTA